MVGGSNTADAVADYLTTCGQRLYLLRKECLKVPDIIFYLAHVPLLRQACGDASMLADNVLQKMYDLARCLHPDNGIALSVTLDAYNQVSLMRRMQTRRTGLYRLRLPEVCLPQYCIYLASDAREREQERLLLGKEPPYRPTPDDYLIRYIKALVWWTMDRNACHVAVALGCFLYGYQPGEIASLAPDYFSPHNIRRVKRRLALQIQARFQRAHIAIGEHHTICTRPPSDQERRLVHQALALFTPWECPHVHPLTPECSILETFFDKASASSEWDRIHALIDPACGGLPRVIREYNHHFPSGSDVRLADPDHALAIPCFRL